MENPFEKITLETIVNASIDKVWRSWSAPEHITKWAQASPEWHAPHAENDLRTNGKFKTTMAAKDGSMQFDFEGVYTKVETNKLIEYQIADGRNVKTVFSVDGKQTKVTQTFDAEKENPIEMQRGGWQSILNSFKQYTESTTF